MQGSIGARMEENVFIKGISTKIEDKRIYLTKGILK